MKRFLVLIAILMVTALGCSQAPEVVQQVETEQPVETQQPSQATEPQPAPPEESAPAEDEATPTSAGTLKEFEMVSKRFAFEPNVISVSRGDTVLLHITSADVAHGIAIPEFGVNTYLPAGETVDVEFIADQTGEFPFRCNVFCGSGHSQMTGRVVVR